MIQYLATARERPAWQAVPAEVRQDLDEPVPLDGSDPAAVYRQFKKDVLPYPTGNIHPRFWGWVMGTGTPLAMLADMLASGMNAHVAGYDQAAAVVERQVIRWLIELLGFPSGASGLLVSGASAANLVGLTVARQAKAGFDVRERGLQGTSPALRVYASAETHGWVDKSCQLLGLGTTSLRRIPVDGEYRIDVDALREAIRRDRGNGHRPICVIGNAGTVNTGATDDLAALAGLCRDEDLWFHVDGAFGALAALSPVLRPALAGMELADSLAFDLHKWGYLPYEVGIALVRDETVHRGAFATTSAYLSGARRGIAVDVLFFADLGLQLSRAFRGLKVWMSLKTHGVHAWRQLIEQNVDQARYLAGRIRDHASLELLAPVPLNVVCFRYVEPGLDAAQLDAVNEEVLLRVQESGFAVPSSTTLGGRFAIRVANTNHRSRREDFDGLVEAVLATGRAVTAEHARGRRRA